MKIFDNGKHLSKTNFVDENNVFVGYDTDQDCCEFADWFIADEPKDTIPDKENNEELDGYVFDTSYFKEVDGDREFDAGGMVIFRLINGGKEKYLHLFNCHNGYYGHGFEFGVGDETWKSGVL